MRPSPNTSLLSLAVLAALSSPAFAQEAGAQVKVDGVIDPVEWQGARHVTDFRMVQPFTQAATRHPTEAWILATPEGLAVAFRNSKVAGVETPRQRTRRDQDAPIDRVNLMLDFDGDGRGGYDFTLSASDGIQDSTITSGGNFSTDWDGLWQHAVVDGEGEWTAEMLIPWHTAPMKKAVGDKRTVAIYLDRVVGSINERMAWPAVSFERPQFLNQFEKIEIPAYSQSLLAITPYVVGLHDRVAKDNSFDAGADVFWKPNSQFQLTATINPDFGQVESDSLVVNFGAQETFFSDKRPFFTENQGFFDFGMLFDNSQLLYTRRIGALADRCLDPANACNEPGDIIGAIKFNGSVGGTQYGAFLADERGDDGRRFAALRLQRGFGTQNLGVMLTNVDRPYFDRSASVLGFDHRWQPDASLTVSSTLVGSDIEQAGQHTRDFAFTSLAQKTLDKGWSLTGLLIHYGKDFEVNDAGYLGRNDLNYAQFEVGKRITELPESSAYSSHNMRFRIEGMQNNDGLWLQKQFRWNGNSQRRDGGNLNWNLQLRTPSYDDTFTRGHGAMYVHNGGTLSVYRGFPRRGNWQFGAEAFIGTRMGLRQDTPYAWSASLSSTYYISDALNIETWVGHAVDQEQLVWQHDNLVGSFNMNRYDLNASLNWNIGTRHELRVKLEALGFDADNPMAWRIGADGRGVRSDDQVAPFSFRNMGFQVRYRYELAPLSNLYVVYGRGGFGFDPYPLGAFEQFGDAFSLRDDEQLVVKLAYRFEL